MSELFQNVNGQLIPRDVCAQKHGGNEQSNAAFDKMTRRFTERQLEIYWLIKSFNHGVTLDEISRILQTTPNAVSGRITELKLAGKIEKRGTRKTRSGCSAAVWVAV